jgi:hypothetical protein
MWVASLACGHFATDFLRSLLPPDVAFSSVECRTQSPNEFSARADITNNTRGDVFLNATFGVKMYKSGIVEMNMQRLKKIGLPPTADDSPAGITPLSVTDPGMIDLLLTVETQDNKKINSPEVLIGKNSTSFFTLDTRTSGLSIWAKGGYDECALIPQQLVSSSPGGPRDKKIYPHMNPAVGTATYNGF